MVGNIYFVSPLDHFDDIATAFIPFLGCYFTCLYLTIHFELDQCPIVTEK